jgi:hypothetical protein
VGFGDWRGKLFDFTGLLNNLVKVIISGTIQIDLLESFSISYENYDRSECNQSNIDRFFFKLHSIYLVNNRLLDCIQPGLISVDWYAHATANINAKNQNLFRLI